MKRLILILMAAVFFLAPVNFTAIGDGSKDKIDVVKFVNTCRANCYRQFAYVFRDKNSKGPDMLVLLVYNHARGEKSSHEESDVYGVLIVSNRSFKEVWGAVLDGSDFKKTFEPISYDFKEFFKCSIVERVGDYKDFEKKILKKIEALFGKEGDRPSIVERKLI